MKLTTTEINKLKKAVHEFNYSNATTRVLMFDESDHDIWVDNFFVSNEYKVYHSTTIYKLAVVDDMFIHGKLHLQGITKFIETEAYKRCDCFGEQMESLYECEALMPL